MRRHLFVTLPALVVAALSHPLSAQAPAADASLPGYEASIKRNTSGEPFVAFRQEPAGRTMTGVPLRQLIVQSYGVQPNQVIGGPDWLGADRWDIQLRADTAVTPQQANLLTQKLLADRFKLVLTRETREMPVYELRLARADGRPGSELKASTANCGALGRGRPAGPPPAGDQGREAGPGAGPAGLPCRMMMAPGRIEGAGQPLSALATFLSNQLGRMVIDKTALTGAFDWVLSYTPDGPIGRGGAPINLPPGVPPPPPIDPNGPSLITALQEQLGLKVESTKGPVEVLVIESVQQPTEN